MNNEAKLKYMGLEQDVRYYYLHFGDPAKEGGQPQYGTATVCAIEYPDPAAPEERTRFARGVAFCSPRDQFNRKKGRSIALGRAILAIECNGSNGDPVPASTNARYLTEGYGWRFLSQGEVALTPYEKKLFRVEG